MRHVSLLGAGEMVVTLKGSGTVKLGQPVKISANRTASACAAGDAVAGVCVSQNGGYLGVQLAGYLEVSYSGALGLGWQEVEADASGGIQPMTQSETPSVKGRPCLVIDLDAVSKTAGILL